MRTVSCHPWFAGVAGIVGRHLSLRTRPQREVGQLIMVTRSCFQWCRRLCVLFGVEKLVDPHGCALCHATCGKKTPTIP